MCWSMLVVGSGSNDGAEKLQADTKDLKATKTDLLLVNSYF